jgi:nucleotide-binding universal stress UspA family protein
LVRKEPLPVQKKILLAVDDSMHSMNALKYTARLSPLIKESTYTLFHVQPIISQFLLDEAKTDFKAKAELDKLIRKNTEYAKRTLEKYKEQMVRMGIADKCVDVATQPRLLGLVKDILDHADKGRYDAIVVGRRGLSRVQKAFMGSVTAKLVEHSTRVPVWVIDGTVTSTKFIVAVDGSEASLRAVDYLSFMIGENPQITLTLFHVLASVRHYFEMKFGKKEADIEQVIAQSDKRQIDDFFIQAHQKFREAGVQDKQIEVKVAKRTANVGKAIVEEAKKGDYGTVVIGRRGTSKAFFMGSVSRYVVDNSSSRAFWLVS